MAHLKRADKAEHNCKKYEEKIRDKMRVQYFEELWKAAIAEEPRVGNDVPPEEPTEVVTSVSKSLRRQESQENLSAEEKSQQKNPIPP